MAASTIGKETPQINAREKVIGRAIYGGDYKMPGMLHMKVLRSPYPHARIVHIETVAARALPGVHAVLTSEDTPKTLTGVHHKEHRILAAGKVRFVGEEVVAVAAVDEDTARDALDLIEIEYEVLPAVTDMGDALGQNAPQIHEGHSNLAHEYALAQGDVDAAFARSAVVYEADYEVHSQYPGYLEPMATVAWMTGNGRLNVWTSTQMVSLQRMRFAEALEMPVSMIRVMQSTVGGGFGGKAVEECNSLICAFVASRVDRPVRFLNSRLDDFQGARMSVPERVWLKLGMDEKGRIIAKDSKILAECGAYAGLAGHVLQVSTIRGDNMHHHLKDNRAHSQLVYTNNPPRGAFRGFGGQQMMFAVNSHITAMAEKLGLDPLDVHKLNAVRAGATTIYGFQIGSSGLSDCLDQCAEATRWYEKRARERGTGKLRRGIGVAAAMHVSANRSMGNWDGSTVVLKMDPDGRVIILTGESDMGQGAFTMLAQLAAHELGLGLDRITVLPADTDSSPFGLGSIASRVTVTAGPAVLKAAKEMKGKMFDIAAEQLGVAVDDLDADDGQIFVRSAGANRMLSYGAIARMHIFRRGGEDLSVRATHDTDTVLANKQQYGNVAPAYSFAAEIAEVEVDVETGQVRLVDIFVSDDCGKALNPLAIHGQSCGAVAQGIGWTLYEEPRFEGGHLQNGNFADYTIPTADAVPTIRSGLIESNDPNGPLGAKGASETAIVPVGGAIANAIYDAIGIRFQALPITPEKVLAAIRARAADENAASPSGLEHA